MKFHVYPYLVLFSAIIFILSFQVPGIESHSDVEESSDIISLKSKTAIVKNTQKFPTNLEANTNEIKIYYAQQVIPV